MNTLEKLQLCRNNDLTASHISIDDIHFDNADLKNLRTDTMVLTASTLKQADLSEVNWRHSKIIDTKLTQSTIRSAVFRMCQFKNVNASSCDFSQTKLENCEMQGLDFESSVFHGASLVDSNISRANFESASLEHVDATGVIARGCDFRSANLSNTSFLDADLRGADFSGATLTGSDFGGADLRGAIFDQCDLSQANFYGSRLDENAEQPQQTKATEKQATADTATEALAAGVGPIVAQLLKHGNSEGLIDNNTHQKLLDELLASGWLEGKGAANNSNDSVTETTEMLLKQIQSTDIASLLSSLNQESEQAPDTVIQLLNNLVEQLKLGEQGSVEDIISTLTSVYEKPK